MISSRRWLLWAAVMAVPLAVLLICFLADGDGPCCKVQHGGDSSHAPAPDDCPCVCHGPSPAIATAGLSDGPLPVAFYRHRHHPAAPATGVVRNIERPPKQECFPG